MAIKKNLYEWTTYQVQESIYLFITNIQGTLNILYYNNNINNIITI